MPMAVVGIVMKFFQIVISIVVGMTAESTALSMVREVVFGVGFALLPAPVFRAGRCAVLHAAVGYPDLPDRRLSDLQDLP